MEEKSSDKPKELLVLAHTVILGNRSDFRIVDLEAGEVLKTGIPSLLNQGCVGDTVKLGSVIYHIGGFRPVDGYFASDFNYGDDLDQHHVHLGASCLELGSDKWKNINHMNDYDVSPSCASLGGKIYALGLISEQTCIGEVFDPQLGCWEPLLPPSDICLKSFVVSPPVISDEKNHRLLVHIDDTNSLYAYYPDDSRRWECLIPNFSLWYPAAGTLIDDVLYFHLVETLDCFAAFDLSRKAWLKVKYSSNFPPDISFNEWEGMFHLDDGILCLANYCPFGDPVQTNLRFVKLRLQRISSQDLLVTFVSSQCFPFEGRFRSHRFILL